MAIGYPEAEISRLLLEKRWLRGQELEIDTGQKPSLAKVFLAGKNLDIITVESWVRAIDTDLRTAGLALQVAFKEHSIYLPLYCPDGHEDPGIPKLLNDKDAQVCWGDFLDSFAMDNEFPDSIGGTHQSEYRYAPDFCLMKNDCTQFFKVTGLGISTFQPSKAGEITKGNVDMLAARDRQRAAISSSANTHFQTPTSNKLEKALSQRERDTLLTIVAVLLELIQSPTAGRNSEAAVIKEMLKNYDEKPGISKRNLEQKFAEAKRILGNR